MNGYKVWVRTDPHPCKHWSDYIDFAFDDDQDGNDYQMAAYGGRNRYNLQRRREVMPVLLKAWPPAAEVAADIDLLRQGLTPQQIELIKAGAPVDWAENWH